MNNNRPRSLSTPYNYDNAQIRKKANDLLYKNFLPQGNYYLNELSLAVVSFCFAGTIFALDNIFFFLYPRVFLII